MAEIEPAAAARVVFATIIGIDLFNAERVLPPLNPNHPNHNMKTPRVAKPILCPGIAFDLPSGLYFPILGQSIITAVSAVQPPTEWTTVEPAKSMNPSCESHPPPHIQCPTIGDMHAAINAL